MSFKRFDQEDIAISAESIVAPLWSTDNIQLQTFFTSSAQASSNTGRFYNVVYDIDVNLTSNANTARPQMSLAFGNKNGDGDALYDTGVPGKSPTSSIYGQYRNLVFGDEEQDFNFAGVSSNSIYIINLDRSRYKEKLFPGTFELTLSTSSGTIKLTDNSNDITSLSYTDSGRVYDIVSGSAGTAYNADSGFRGHTESRGAYGKFLPDVGVIILNAYALDATVATGGIALGTDNTTGSVLAKNINKIYNAIKLGTSFKLQSEETVSSNFVFVRVRNSEFNYSTNPSNLDSVGELTHEVMINTPQAYITTVGLYNDNNDLLGVAKLSRPLLKDFTSEALIRIKLDY